MYSNNDFRYYKGGSYLAHYGKKGMKWKKHLKATTEWWKNNVTGSNIRDEAIQAQRNSFYYSGKDKRTEKALYKHSEKMQKEYNKTLPGRIKKIVRGTDRTLTPHDMTSRDKKNLKQLAKDIKQIKKEERKKNKKVHARFFKTTGRSGFTDTQAVNREKGYGKKNPFKTTLSDQQVKNKANKKKHVILRVNGKIVTGKDIVKRMFKRG